MKKFLALFITLTMCLLIYIFREDITRYFITEYEYKNSNVKQTPNEYKKNLDIAFVKETDDFYPNSYQDLLNIYYTSLNNGVDSFIYYCPKEYKSCIKDSEKLANDQNTLSSINNLVHPYNSYSSLSAKINTYGKVEVNVNKQYSKEEIALLNNKVNEIYNALIKDNMTTTDKIKAIHDYIINISNYDKEKADSIVNGQIVGTSNYKSETAYGVLFQNFGICSGFSDAMELFLNKMGIPTYKIASQTHIWNLVNVDGTWLHLDLTWDNPIVNGSGKLLLHDFFLIPTTTLNTLNTGHHTYDKNIYKEAA